MYFGKARRKTNVIEQMQAREKVSAVSGLYTDPTLNSYPIIQAPISVLLRQTKWVWGGKGWRGEKGTRELVASIILF